MVGYLSSRKLVNVIGRIKYITNEKKQENIIDFHNTTDNDFWRMLARENRKRHKEVNARGKCCEARELIIGIPQEYEITAQQLCEIFKNRFKVDCVCAIHQNKKKGVINKHCHLIFSEREKLKEPIIQEEKRATRNYYYDKKGHKCKKSEAVKIVKKGTILQKKEEKFFSNKNDFFKTQDFVYKCKELFLRNTFNLEWSYEGEKRNKQLSEKHIGKNNPKEDYIKRNNELKSIVKNVCNASDFIFNQEKGTMLEEFKNGYNIENFFAPNYEENANKVFGFVQEVQSVYKTRVKNEVKFHNSVNQDVQFLQKEDYIYEPIQEQIINDYEVQSKTRKKGKVIEFLKEKLESMLERIKKLISIQDLLYIEPKNRLELYQDKKNNNLYLEDQGKLRKEKHREKEDYEPEL